MSLPVSAQDWSHPDYIQKDCGEGVTVGVGEVFAGMIPIAPSVPSACSGTENDLIAKMRAQDQQDWEALSNRACSAKQGWVENGPGICHAGGPPPICKRTDHWHRDPLSASTAYRENKQGIAQHRQQQMSDLGCGCWLNLARQSPSAVSLGSTSSNPYDSQPQGTNPYTSAAVVPCSNDSNCSVAEPGSYCSAKKVCEFPGLGMKVVQKAVAGTDGVATKLIQDEAKDAILQVLPGQIANVLTEMASNNLITAGAKLFESTSTDQLIPSYKSSLQQLRTELSTLENLYTQLKRFDSGKSPYASYARSDMVAQIQKTKGDIRATMDNAIGFLAGAENQQEFPKGSCTNVLDFQNSAIMATAARLLSAGSQ